jgi:hypothetical protein
MDMRCIAVAAMLSMVMPSTGFAAGGEGTEQATQPSAELAIAMALYAGGITLGKVDMSATIRANTYHAVSNLQTAGIVNAFWQSTIQATTNGTVGRGTIRPQLYDSFSTGRSNHKQEVSLTYQPDGTIRLYANPPYDTNRYKVSEAQKKDTFDPLSGIVYVTSGTAAKNNPCNVTIPVFDGKRRYNIEMTFDKMTDISMDNGLYKGQAFQCRARYRQIAGFKQKIIEDNAHFPIIHAWIVPYPSGMAGRNFVVPLRVWADTPYGVVAAVTTMVKINGIDKGQGGR